MAPALAARAPTSSYLFYDCQTDDVRLVLTVLGEAERFGAVRQSCRGHGVGRARGPGRRRAGPRRGRRRRGVRGERRQRGQRHRRVGRPAEARRALREKRCRAFARAAALT